MTNQSLSTTKLKKLAAEIRSELRSILRQLDDLQCPISRFELLPGIKEGEPRFYVHFDDRNRRRIKGLRLRTTSVALPDERITDAVLSASQAIWHLKDRLHQWSKLVKQGDIVETHANKCPDLLICADLANWKKHGRHGNRSGSKPSLGLVKFDTSQSGIIELYYEGAKKEKELLVSNPTPLPFIVPVIVGATETEIGSSLDILSVAFSHWKTLIRQLGILVGQDRETIILRQMLGF